MVTLYVKSTTGNSVLATRPNCIKEAQFILREHSKHI